MSALGLGRVKTKSDLVVMPSGRQIFAFFCSPHDHRAQNSRCGDTARSFYTVRVIFVRSTRSRRSRHVRFDRVRTFAPAANRRDVPGGEGADSVPRNLGGRTTGAMPYRHRLRQTRQKFPCRSAVGHPSQLNTGPNLEHRLGYSGAANSALPPPCRAPFRGGMEHLRNPSAG
jgi:hypothetical protein